MGLEPVMRDKEHREVRSNRTSERAGELSVELISDGVLSLDSGTSRSMVVSSKCGTCLTNKNLQLLGTL